MKSLNQKLLNLVSDEAFAKIEHMASRPNLFKIVGRTHTETWHSMFLSWLLSPTSSHNLGSFPLQRFLGALTDPVFFFDSQHDVDTIARYASTFDLESAQVTPEYPCDDSRIDVFIEVNNPSNERDLVILVEQKVNAPIVKAQANQYLQCLDKAHQSALAIPVYVAPAERFHLTSAEETFGDSSWYGIDYQILHDSVLIPILNHPKLNSEVATLIEQYIDVLRIPNNGRKLAVTDEEKELALLLFDKHRDAFEAIQTALSDTTDISLVPTTSKKKELELVVNGTSIKGSTVPNFYTKALHFIVDHKLGIPDLIPFLTSNKRYLINDKPKHPTENDFTKPIEYQGYYVETHKSREIAIRALAKYFIAADQSIELPLGND